MTVTVLGMKNEDQINPVFSAWMYGNPEELIVDVQGDSITVSAAPSYNIALERNTVMEHYGTYDFKETTKTDAVHYDLDPVYGRMYGYGVAYQRSKGRESGRYYFDKFTAVVGLQSK